MRDNCGSPNFGGPKRHVMLHDFVRGRRYFQSTVNPGLGMPLNPLAYFQVLAFTFFFSLGRRAAWQREPTYGKEHDVYK
jgi:hypothetical protein